MYAYIAITVFTFGLKVSSSLCDCLMDAHVTSDSTLHEYYVVYKLEYIDEIDYIVAID